MKSDILADVKEYYQSKVVKYLLQYALIVMIRDAGLLTHTKSLILSNWKNMGNTVLLSKSM